MACCTSKKCLTVYFLIFLILICSVISFFATQLMLHGNAWKHDTSHEHNWLHKELELTPTEIAKFDAFEGEYQEERKIQMKEFQQRMKKLAKLLRETDRYTVEVEQSIHNLHEVHAKLQRLSIEHYYEMLSVLPKQKQKKLRNLAVEALSQPE